MPQVNMNIVLKIQSFLPYETDEMECYLEDMADRGYLLREMFGSLLRFSRRQDNGLRYAYHLISSKTGQNVEEEREQLDCDGWKLICQNARIAVFRKSRPACEEPTRFAKIKVPASVRVTQRNGLLVALLLLVFCGNGCALNLVRLKQASFVYSTDFPLVCLLFLCGTMLFLNCLVYFIGELYDTVVLNKRRNLESEGTDSGQYARTRFKRTMFNIGDRLMIGVFLLLILISIFVLCIASLSIKIFIPVLWLIWALGMIYEWTGNRDVILSLAILTMVTYAISLAAIGTIL